MKETRPLEQTSKRTEAHAAKARERQAGHGHRRDESAVAQHAEVACARRRTRGADAEGAGIPRKKRPHLVEPGGGLREACDAAVDLAARVAVAATATATATAIDAAAIAASGATGEAVAALATAVDGESTRAEQTRAIDTHGGRFARRSSHEDASGAAPSSAAVHPSIINHPSIIKYRPLPNLRPMCLNLAEPTPPCQN